MVGGWEIAIGDGAELPPCLTNCLSATGAGAGTAAGTGGGGRRSGRGEEQAFGRGGIGLDRRGGVPEVGFPQCDV